LSLKKVLKIQENQKNAKNNKKTKKENKQPTRTEKKFGRVLIGRAPYHSARGRSIGIALPFALPKVASQKGEVPSGACVGHSLITTQGPPKFL
jgi:hypothetical protein